MLNKHEPLLIFLGTPSRAILRIAVENTMGGLVRMRMSASSSGEEESGTLADDQCFRFFLAACIANAAYKRRDPYPAVGNAGI